MARKAQHKVSVVAQGVNQVTGPMRAASKDLAAMSSAVANSDQQLVSSSKRAEVALKSKAKAASAMQATIKSSPEQFSKAAGAVSLFASAVGSSGGKAAMATTQIANLGALVITGGPIGIGIAALTGIVAGLTWAFEDSGDEAKSFADDLKRLQGEADTAQSELESLQRKLEDFGKGSHEAAIDRLQAEIAILEASKAQYDVQSSMVEIDEHGNEIVDEHTRKIQDQTFELGLQLDAKRKALQLERELLAAETLRDQERERASAKEKAADQKRSERRRQAEVRSSAEFDRRMAMITLRTDAELAASKRVEEAEQRRVELDREGAEKARAIMAKMREEQQQAAQARLVQAVQYGEIAGQVFGNVAAAAAQGDSDAVKSGAKAAGQIILQAAAKSAAEAFSSMVGVPIIGPALGAAAAGAAYAFAMSYLNKFAAGGFVGGTAGRDDQPILAQRGEYVMSRGEVAAAQSTGAVPDRLGGGSGGGGGMQVTAVFGPSSARTPLERKRFLMSHSRELEELINDGHIRIKRVG